MSISASTSSYMSISMSVYLHMETEIFCKRANFSIGKQSYHNHDDHIHQEVIIIFYYFVLTNKLTNIEKPGKGCFGYKKTRNAESNAKRRERENGMKLAVLWIQVWLQPDPKLFEN
jgi:hypothetical protein